MLRLRTFGSESSYFGPEEKNGTLREKPRGPIDGGRRKQNESAAVHFINLQIHPPGLSIAVHFQRHASNSIHVCCRIRLLHLTTACLAGLAFVQLILDQQCFTQKLLFLSLKAFTNTLKLLLLLIAH